MTQALRAVLYQRIGVAAVSGPKPAIGIAVQIITPSIVIAESGPRHPIVAVLYYFGLAIAIPALSSRWVPIMALLCPGWDSSVGSGLQISYAFSIVPPGLIL